MEEKDFLDRKGNSIYELDFNKVSRLMPNAKMVDDFLIADNYIEQFNSVDTKKTQYPICLHLYMCMICQEGEAELRVNFKTCKLTSKSIVFMMKNDVFEIVGVTDNFKCEMIVFGGSATSNAQFRGDTITALAVRNHIAENPIITLDDKVASKVKTMTSLIKETIDDREMNDELKMIAVKALFGAMSCFFIPKMGSLNAEQLSSVKLSRKEMIFRNFIRNVEMYYKKERQITYYANLEYITPKYLSTVVYEVSNRHAGDWINEYVIFEAKKLLGSEYLSIQEICYRLNFSNQSFFGKYFKRHTGMSPLEYRKSVAK